MRVVKRVLFAVFLGVFFGFAGCDPPMPDDLPSLIEYMNSDAQEYHVNAANKVAEVYGEEGLLHVLREGPLKARYRAARWLWRFPSDQVEQALIEVVTTETDPFLRTQALYSLKHVGTPKALPAVEAATRATDERVAFTAREALASIESRNRTR